MQIAFVDHADHERTGSSRFVRDIVAGLGETTVLLAGAAGSPRTDDAVVETFVAGGHDLWIFFETEAVAARLVPLGLRGAVIVPTPERVHAVPDAHLQTFVLSRFAAFSRSLHDRLQSILCRSASFSYWPAPEPATERQADRGEWSAFFRERTSHEVPNAASVIGQCRVLGISRLHIHRTGDAGGMSPDALVRLGRIDGVGVTTSSFVDDRAVYGEIARRAPVVFASRLVDGIGLATVEAMAAGQVVIAPDRPTANEVISHLSSGILYDPQRPEALPSLSPERVFSLSAGARARAAAGRAAWEADVPRFVSFLVDDGRRWSASDSSAGFANGLRRRAHERRIIRARK